MNLSLKNILRRFTSGRFVAVDFDSRCLRVVHAEAIGSQVRVLKLASAPMPDGIDLSDSQAVGAHLGQSLRQMGLHGVAISMNLPRGQAVLKTINLPVSATQRELPGMVQYQVEKELPFRAEEAVIDFTIEKHAQAADSAAPAGGGGLSVLVAAARLPAIDAYRQVAISAGLHLSRLGLRPYANLRCVQAHLSAAGAGAAQGPVALVSIGADETEIDVVNDGALAFSRSAVVKVPPASAGEVAAAEALAAVTAEVLRSIQSYHTLQHGGDVASILVCGGTGLEQAIQTELRNRLNLPCETFNPARAMGLMDQPEIPAFISALGLAISLGPDGQLPLDFINPKRPVIGDNRKRTRIIAAVAAAVVLLAAVTAGGAAWLGGKKTHLEQLQTKHAALKKVNAGVRDLDARYKAVSDWESSNRPWLDHLLRVSAMFPSASEAYIPNIRMNADGSIGFTICAKTSEAIAELGQRAREAGYELRPQRLYSMGDPLGYVFRADAQLTFKPDSKTALAALVPVPRPEDDVSAAPKTVVTPPKPKPAATPPAAKTDTPATTKAPANAAGGGRGRRNPQP